MDQYTGSLSQLRFMTHATVSRESFRQQGDWRLPLSSLTSLMLWHLPEKVAAPPLERLRLPPLQVVRSVAPSRPSIQHRTNVHRNMGMGGSISVLQGKSCFS